MDHIMKITNKHGLPEPLVTAVNNHKYKAVGDISVTRLIDSPRIRVLMAKHFHEIEEDVIDRIWALFGEANHAVLEMAAGPDDIAEKRYHAEVNGWDLNGQLDLIHKGTLYDFKTTSVWKVIYGEFKDYEYQLNVLRYLIYKNDPDLVINDIAIIAILKDWSRTKADTTDNYPQHQVATIYLEIWGKDFVEQQVLDLVKKHQQAEKELPECSNEDRWSERDVFAIKKGANKRAVRLLDTMEQVNDYVALKSLEISEKQSSTKHWIETRHGDKYKRCHDYCAVKNFCEQYQSRNDNIET
jgi:hypothetical protein